ncbi:hypothetical protein MTR_5g033790 [Medicago truncatula]|uniref:Uncharacterized protein n=1 Tax=Medicago truncatula TaxID=3880 RepID=G7K065_MEDTR|nr:hypothetical protein MTR_5g033790 [Medicago truncatula]
MSREFNPSSSRDTTFPPFAALEASSFHKTITILRKDGLDNRYDSDVEEEVEGKGCAEVDDCP